MPNGRRRPRAFVVVLRAKRARNARFTRSAICPMNACGTLRPITSPQNVVRDTPWPVACAARLRTRSAPEVPSIMAITMVRARSGSVTAIPWISVTDWANSALASRKTAVSTPVSARLMPVPTPGMTADAPTPAPPAVTAVRKWRSRMRMTCSGVASGCRRRTFRTCASTAGRWVVSSRSKPRTAIGYSGPCGGSRCVGAICAGMTCAGLTACIAASSRLGRLIIDWPAVASRDGGDAIVSIAGASRRLRL